MNILFFGKALYSYPEATLNFIFNIILLTNRMIYCTVLFSLLSVEHIFNPTLRGLDEDNK